MIHIGSKSKLAIVLSKLKGFDTRKVSKEQYEMDSETGATALWNAYQLGDLKDLEVYDLGCGTGYLGIGALLLGAKKVVFVDSDEKALEIARKNLETADSFVKSEGSLYRKGEFRRMDIKALRGVQTEVVVQNPPFGTKVRNADREFIEKALDIAPKVYSFHKSETKTFLEGFLAKKNAKITHIWDFQYPIKASYSFHRRQIHRINVSCIRFVRD